MKLKLFLVCLTALGATACDSNTVVGCDELGADGPGLRAQAVVRAVDTLAAEADQLSTELLGVCNDLATELGIEAPAPTEGQEEREATCAAVAAEIEAIITEADASVTVIVSPPVCSFSVDVLADCVAECDVDVTAAPEVTCTGGEISGSCDAMCEGTCTVEASAECTGECSATCTGTCSGACTGTCDGTCSATDDEGNCVGTCDGTCTGSCSAECTGSCSGSCTAEANGMCEGTCSGGCSGEFTEPMCDGSANVEANAECQATCESEITAEATCSEPSVSVDFAGEAAGGRVADLQRALQLHWGRLLGLTARIEATASAAGTAASSAGDLASASALCIASIGTVAARAVGSFSVSVEVSIEVSASASTN